MTATLFTPPLEIIHLSGISWQAYETLRSELRERRFRLIYNRHTLEIMAGSPEHKLSKEVLGRFVETLAEETDLPIYPLGSTTFQRSELQHCTENLAEGKRLLYEEGRLNCLPTKGKTCKI